MTPFPGETRRQQKERHRQERIAQERRRASVFGTEDRFERNLWRYFGFFAVLSALVTLAIIAAIVVVLIEVF